jgi:hypothetical protein
MQALSLPISLQQHQCHNPCLCARCWFPVRRSRWNTPRNSSSSHCCAAGLPKALQEWADYQIEMRLLKMLPGQVLISLQ